METEEKVINAVKKANAVPDSIQLSSGVVLETHQANPLLLISVMSAFPRPVPPTQFIEIMGREMENPDDPDYISRVQAWKTENSNAVLGALILLGTKLKSKPSDIPGPDDDDWLNTYETLGLQIKPKNKDWRYLKWVMTIACVSEKDLQLIQEAVGGKSGVKESDVSAAATFPGSN